MTILSPFKVSIEIEEDEVLAAVVTNFLFVVGFEEGTEDSVSMLYQECNKLAGHECQNQDRGGSGFIIGVNFI